MKLLDAEYQIGRTKVFIRNPMTVRALNKRSVTDLERRTNLLDPLST